MSEDTRGQLIDSATRLFSERGFYGVSIANIADDLGLTKQALLHHFGTKERLYAAVLEKLTSDMEAAFDAAVDETAAPLEQLQSAFAAFASGQIESVMRVRLLLREMLDNKRRADSAKTWYLKPFLARLTAMVKATPRWQNATDTEALIGSYQLLGAVNFFLISEPTLTGIYGDDLVADQQRLFPDLLKDLVAKTMG